MLPTHTHTQQTIFVNTHSVELQKGALQHKQHTVMQNYNVTVEKVSWL